MKFAAIRIYGDVVQLDQIVAVSTNKLCCTGGITIQYARVSGMQDHVLKAIDYASRKINSREMGGRTFIVVDVETCKEITY